MSDLTLCGQCGQPVSVSSTVCPHCGEPLRMHYAVPDYARPPTDFLRTSQVPVVDDAEARSLAVANAVQQLAALEHGFRQEMVNLIAWRAHALAGAKPRARKSRTPPTQTTTTGRRRTPPKQSTRNASAAIELAFAIVVLILAIAYLAGQSDRFPIAILAIFTLMGYAVWRAISRRS